MRTGNMPPMKCPVKVTYRPTRSDRWEIVGDVQGKTIRVSSGQWTIARNEWVSRAGYETYPLGFYPELEIVDLELNGKLWAWPTEVVEIKGRIAVRPRQPRGGSQYVLGEGRR